MPQPHVSFTFGFLNTNPADNDNWSSTQSISDPNSVNKARESINKDKSIISDERSINQQI
jgi:hypothetical protein